MRWLLVLPLLCLTLVLTRADGPGDNRFENVRKIPPVPTETIPEKDKQELQAGLDQLGKEIDALRLALKDKPALLALLPDVQIYFNAVHYGLKYDEIFAKNEIPAAKKLLATGVERAKLLQEGKHPWTTATGAIVRGYISKIDGSVQPYGLIVPKNYREGQTDKHRLDIWCHGRGETLSEINFLRGRTGNMGDFAPEGAFVLHPYGRYCNANKLAGEIDVLEGIDTVQKSYPIDPDRLVIRGFSMGGAACWHLAVHYPSKWCAANPGAGFSETRDFLKVFQNEDVSNAPGFEKKLWHLYDCTDYALNLYNLPTIAYSGAIDKQKQAADMMFQAMKAQGLDLIHIIGPNTGHGWEKNAKIEVAKLIDALAKKGRPALPEKVKFVTYTLRYNHSYWVTIDAMQEHWEEARVEAEIIDRKSIKVKTTGVTALTLQFPAGSLIDDRSLSYDVDDIRIQGPAIKKDEPIIIRAKKEATGWVSVDSFDGKELRKKHGLQGPIDDAFLDRFIMVRPTGSLMNDAVGKWVDAEMKRAITHWRQQFRGEAIVKDDKDITEEDIRYSNLILWGDPSSNAILKKIADRLPISWKADEIAVAGKHHSSKNHVLSLIYPNPLNPDKYVVLNSGVTYREYDYLNNARQIPKLPDWAVIDITVPPNARTPGKIISADFFDESWKLKGKGK